VKCRGGFLDDGGLEQFGVTSGGQSGSEIAGRRMMTCSTSAVAVCCSSASLCSVINRAFSIAITACAAKLCNSAICLSEKGWTSRR